MFPGMGGRGINPKQLEKQMKALGIDIEEIEDVKEVIIRTGSKEIVFKDAQVSIMNARGMKTYQLVGTPEERALEKEIPEEDITLVATQTNVSRDVAKQALKESKGDLAEAIMKLSENK
ncbi:nascent polypeptide-associated complex protein [Methanocella sp. CWC-04]|uniref:Nascent polypeptide-associated complex protein n=1 Tax=Methanooceanicella nereidis TaxID=2052831 RepID=A0AAP2W7R3_9EURY|nr:nascent polypeptide-associated complex protein [Methanocella sp. CWC-04]MCD1295316.1 nascent polypeptide-associated complex protein [Methanocella sp. CWC-04]